MENEPIINEGKGPHDMTNDGVLAYGVILGRFIFEKEGYTVFVISDLPHIGASDVFMVYQISKADYLKLLAKSCQHQIPTPPVSSITTDKCKKRFLCGESAYCERYYCNLSDVDLTLAEKLTPCCPNCGKEYTGDKFCRECGKKLI